VLRRPARNVRRARRPPPHDLEESIDGQEGFAFTLINTIIKKGNRSSPRSVIALQNAQGFGGSFAGFYRVVASECSNQGNSNDVDLETRERERDEA
jgi:hypothetical protein